MPGSSRCVHGSVCRSLEQVPGAVCELELHKAWI